MVTFLYFIHPRLIKYLLIYSVSFQVRDCGESPLHAVELQQQRSAVLWVPVQDVCQAGWYWAVFAQGPILRSSKYKSYKFKLVIFTFVKIQSSK